MVHHIFDRLSDPNGPEILIRPARCDEPGATKRFSFTGDLDKSGEITGEGTLTIDKGLPAQENCIKIGNFLGIGIKSIRSKFINGLADSTTLIEFKDGGYKQVEVIVESGVARGLYRLEADTWWSLGTVVNGRVDGTCMFSQRSYVRILKKEHLITPLKWFS